MTRPSPAPDKLALAFQALKAGQPRQAERMCRNLLIERPGDARVPALLARVLATLDRLDEAREQVERALALDPQSVPALVENVALARRNGDAATQARVLEQLVALQPQHAGFHHDLAVALLELGQIDGARESLGRALRLAPD